MQTKESQVGSDEFSPDEEVIRKISPDVSLVHFKETEILSPLVHTTDANEHKINCRCECRSLKEKSSKAYVIVPIKQNGNIINVVKLPIYKMHKQPNKNLSRHTKYRVIPNNPDHYDHFSLPVWQMNQSEICSCVNCKDFEQRNLHLYSDAICQTDVQIGPEIIMPPAEEPKKSTRKRSSEVRQQPNPTKWHSLFVNDKSYTRKRSDG